MLLHGALKAQVPENNPVGREYNYDRNGMPVKKDTTGEQLKHRDKYEDSITISYHYWDSTRVNKIDSSINDFYTRFPVPWTNYDLGNLGSASKSFIFQPNMKPGFDAGFHAYDVYLYTPANTRFFQTTRPYSETIYLLGSRAEQMINLFHTQNRKSNFNFGLDFKIISSPGAYKNQSTVTSNGRINTFYQTNNKRYTNNFIFISNKILSSENGGIKPGQNLDSLSFNDPFGASTKLGDNLVTYRSIFNSTINTGTQYKELLLLMRHSYDFGQKDSLVTDSVTYKLFYPRIRLQHTISYAQDNYEYHDFLPVDSDYYKYMHYNISTAEDTVKFNDTWRNLTNDFAIISYPQKNNLNQFLKLNAGVELIKGTVSQFTKEYDNVYTAAEYRNRTRNQLYDIEASGKLYVTGHYAGDYSAYISLQRSLRKNVGSLKVGFQNVTRTPSFITTEFVSDSIRPVVVTSTDTAKAPVNQALTSFPVTGVGNYNKENNTKIFAVIYIPPADLQLGGEYYLISNYTYFNGLYTTDQYSTLFNVLHLYAQKRLRIAKHWNWYLDGHFQQTTGNPPVHVPLVLARSRIAFEGNFFKNLFLSTGFEVRYNTPYKPDSYSPLTGQFYTQNNTNISNLPDISAYLNFRIKGFKGFVRVENLNTISFKNGFSFSNYNYSAPDYPTRGFWFRLGIWWSFVN
jgi:hypothetical protein